MFLLPVKVDFVKYDPSMGGQGTTYHCIVVFGINNHMCSLTWGFIRRPAGAAETGDRETNKNSVDGP